tara:strand:- start:130 stop:339 length:210 start_codon:yes stop_codon:yes gene_type:complete
MNYQVNQTARINEDKIMVEVIVKGQVVATGIYFHAVNQCIDMSHNSKLITLDQRYDIELDIEKGRTIIY